MIIVAAALVLAAGLFFFFYFRAQITATTMRVLRLEGDVSLEDKGKSKTVKENLRLNNDNALSTADESLVSIGLDDTKIVTMDELSRAEFSQQGRKLKLNLTAGSLFFDVTKPLEEDETFNIHTTTMVVGIRGTSGWVSVSGEHETVIITDGTVHIIGTNPVTGEVKEIDVHAGQRVSVYLYNDREVDSIMFTVDDITERDLPEFVLDRLREDPELLDKVCAQTGWDKPWILGYVKPTPSPTPKPDQKDDSEGTGLKTTPTPTATPTAEPTKTGKKKTPEEEMQELLELLQALATPTPTPTPEPEVTSSNNYVEEEEEEEEEPTPTPTPTPTPSPTPGPTNPFSQSTNSSATFDGTTFTFADGSTTTGSVNWGAGTAMVNAPANIRLPFTVTDSTNPSNQLTLDIDPTYGICTNLNPQQPVNPGESINVVWRVGGNTDMVVRNIYGLANTIHTYGDSTDRWYGLDQIVGADGEQYYHLYTGQGVVDTWVRQSDGYVTDTDPS